MMMSYQKNTVLLIKQGFINSYANSQNVRIWRNVNPDVYVLYNVCITTYFYSRKISV